MANITFNDYTAPSIVENSLSVTLGIFFDGTLNNKNNTNARKGKKDGYEYKAYKNYGGSKDENTSYNNDWSNIARLWENYHKSNAIYIEGIGTLDLKDDEMDGFAYGSKVTGIKEKVKASCLEISKKVNSLVLSSGKKKLSSITLDVFGFSRGAAAARHFVYEVSKRVKSDKFGKLGIELRNHNIDTEQLTIYIRFLGVFDTVSSYSENVWTTSPNFSNDIDELQLDTISKAKKIVHFISANEHRINFDLTDIIKYDSAKRKSVLMGTEKKFPGVHSDIGGGYENGNEKKDEIINGNEEIQKKRKEQLVSEGWFTEEQLIIHEYRHKLSSDRNVKKTYSFIPLQFMSEYGLLNSLKIDDTQIKLKYKITNDALLMQVKERLKQYVMGSGKPYEFRWFHEIHKQYKGAKIPEQRYADYQKELNEQKNLRQLRNEYLHWSADYDWVGMDPREDGKRKVH